MKHIIDDADKNKYEAYTKQEVLNVIQEAISSGQLPEEINGLVLTFKNPIDNQAYKIAFCTQAKYNELESGGNLEPNCVYYITDDTSYEDITTAIDNLGNYILNTAIPTFSSLNNRVTALENKKLYQHTIVYVDDIEVDSSNHFEIHIIFDFFSTDNAIVQSLSDLKSLLETQKPSKASGFKKLISGQSVIGTNNAFIVIYEANNVNVIYDDLVTIAMTSNGTFTDSVTTIY